MAILLCLLMVYLLRRELNNTSGGGYRFQTTYIYGNYRGKQTI